MQFINVEKSIYQEHIQDFSVKSDNENLEILFCVTVRSDHLICIYSITFFVIVSSKDSIHKFLDIECIDFQMKKKETSM